MPSCPTRERMTALHLLSMSEILQLKILFFSPPSIDTILTDESVSKSFWETAFFKVSICNQKKNVASFLQSYFWFNQYYTEVYFMVTAPDFSKITCDLIWWLELFILWWDYKQTTSPWQSLLQEPYLLWVHRGRCKKKKILWSGIFSWIRKKRHYTCAFFVTAVLSKSAVDQFDHFVLCFSRTDV